MSTNIYIIINRLIVKLILKNVDRQNDSAAPVIDSKEPEM